MTKPDGPPTPMQVAGVGAWFLIFGLGVVVIELCVGDHPFSGTPMSWGLGEAFSVMGGVFLYFFGAATESPRPSHHDQEAP